MITRCFWILICVVALSPRIDAQKYKCLILSYPGTGSQSGEYYRPGTYNSKEYGNDRSTLLQYTSLSDDDTDEDSETDEFETEEEEDDDEDEEWESDGEEAGPRNNQSYFSHILRRFKRQIPNLNDTSQEIIASVIKNVTKVDPLKLVQMVLNRTSSAGVDDGVHDDREAMYEYDNTEFREYDSETSKSHYMKTNTHIYTTNTTFSGLVKCDNPSQKVHIRKVTTGYSATGYCTRQTTSNCTKDMTDFKPILDCEGQFAECRVDLDREDLINCGQSNYLLIEYDCIYDHSLLDICSNSYVSRWGEVAIKSPSYPRPASVPTHNIRTCECEISTDAKSSLSVDYLSSAMSGSDDKCDEEVLLFEQKYNANKMSRFQVTGEVCGQKLDYRRRFGDNIIRLTYLLGRGDATKTRGGFLAGITANSMGKSTSLLTVKCSAVKSTTAAIPNKVPSLRKTIKTPTTTIEKRVYTQPVQVPNYITTTSTPLLTTPRWRIGPRGRKYIPRPGNPYGPLFLDGKGLKGLRRRRPGLRRRIIYRTTVAPSTLHTTTTKTTTTILAAIKPRVPEITTRRTVLVNRPTDKTLKINSAGAVQAIEKQPTEDKPAEAKTDDGTMVAIIVSVASVMLIIVSIGFYYFHRKRQRKIGEHRRSSEISSMWFSEYYYGIADTLRQRLSGNKKETQVMGHNYGNTDDSCYESYGTDITHEDDISSHKKVDVEKSNSFKQISLKSSNSYEIQKFVDKASEPMNISCISCSVDVPRVEPVTEIKLVAPPRKNRKRTIPPPPTHLTPTLEPKQMSQTTTEAPGIKHNNIQSKDLKPGVIKTPSPNKSPIQRWQERKLLSPKELKLLKPKNLKPVQPMPAKSNRITDLRLAIPKMLQLAAPKSPGSTLPKSPDINGKSSLSLNAPDYTDDYDNNCTLKPPIREVKSHQPLSRLSPSRQPQKQVHSPNTDDAVSAQALQYITVDTDTGDNNDVYDDCMSSPTQLPQHHIDPIIQIIEHDSTEYATIPEMRVMANSEC